MFGFIKKMSFLVFNVLNPISPKFVSMNNQECRIRPEIINTNSNEPTFYPYSIEVNKCGGSCNNISDAYAKLCVPDVVKNINIKVFNLISRTIETRHIKWHKTCKCKCRLDASVYDNKQRWNNDKWRYECKELCDNGRCDKELIWNSNNYECECDKLCDVGEYLDYKNSKCWKRLVDKLVEGCSRNIGGNKMIYNVTLNNYEIICNSCTVYIVLLVIFSIISRSIINAFIYFHWYLKRWYTEITTY